MGEAAPHPPRSQKLLEVVLGQDSERGAPRTTPAWRGSADTEPRLRAPRPPPHLHAASPRAPPATDGGRASVVAGSFPVSPGAAAPAPPARCKHTPREGRGGAAPWQPRPEEEARGSGAAIFGGVGSPPLRHPAIDVEHRLASFAL